MSADKDQTMGSSEGQPFQHEALAVGSKAQFMQFTGQRSFQQGDPAAILRQLLTPSAGEKPVIQHGPGAMRDDELFFTESSGGQALQRGHRVVKSDGRTNATKERHQELSMKKKGGIEGVDVEKTAAYQPGEIWGAHVEKTADYQPGEISPCSPGPYGPPGDVSPRSPARPAFN